MRSLKRKVTRGLVARGGLLLTGVAVLALERLDDQTGADGLRAGLHAGLLAVDDRDDFLKIRLKQARGDTGGLQTEAALGDGLATPRTLHTTTDLLAREFANETHSPPQ